MKIPTRPPTLEDIMRENLEYTAHLVRGGKPLQLILELVPTQIGFDWRLIARVPNDLPNLPYVIMFSEYSREKITAALQPPDDKNTNTKTSRG